MLAAALIACAPASTEPTRPTAATTEAVTVATAADSDRTSIGARPDWRGDPQAMPDAYSWLGPYTPSDTYNVVVVRGVSTRASLRVLGEVKRDLGTKTPARAERYLFNHVSTDPGQEYDWPTVVQTARRGHAVMIYVPYNFVTSKQLARLSRRGIAASFSTTVEYDTYVEVARKGQVIRRFDAGFKPPKKGALKAEAGLDWGARRQNIWATAWAFNERLTRTHISRTWFNGGHHTYVMRKPFY